MKKELFNSETLVFTVTSIFLTHLDVVDTHRFSCFYKDIIVMLTFVAAYLQVLLVYLAQLQQLDRLT